MLGLLITMKAGVPVDFGNTLILTSFLGFTSVQSVLTSIAEPTATNAAKDKVFKFLTTYTSGI